jgi:hypothetical protein
VTIAAVLLEIGDLAGARVRLGDAEASTAWLNAPIRRGSFLVTRSEVAGAEGEGEEARRLSGEALELFREARAVDEEAKEELRRLELFGEAGSRGELEERLAGIDETARRLRAWQLATSLRLARARLCGWLPVTERLAALEALEADLNRSGYALLELPTLQLRAELLIGDGRLLEAQDVLRRAIERIRRVAGELEAPLRKRYLGDPRRQRFLELIRACRPS